MNYEDLTHADYFSTKITAKWQCTVPPEVRKLLKLDVGDILSFVIKDDGRVEAVNFLEIAKHKMRKEYEKEGREFDEAASKNAIEMTRMIMRGFNRKET